MLRSVALRVRQTFHSCGRRQNDNMPPPTAPSTSFTAPLTMALNRA